MTELIDRSQSEALHARPRARSSAAARCWTLIRLTTVPTLTACPPPPPPLAETGSTTSAEPIPSSCVGAASEASPGITTIDPDGEGGREPFEVYCDSSGWILVAEVGQNFDIVKHSFTVDREIARLLDPAVAGDHLANFSFERFDAYGAEWTLRAVVFQPPADPADPADPLSAQVTYLRARDGEAVTPNALGNNWFGKNTSSRVEALTVATSGDTTIAGPTNSTWRALGRYTPGESDPRRSTFYLFGEYDEDPRLHGRPCITPEGQTAACQVLAGLLNDEQGGGPAEMARGVPSGHENYGDGVQKGWGRAGTYWLRDDRPEMPQVATR